MILYVGQYLISVKIYFSILITLISRQKSYHILKGIVIFEGRYSDVEICTKLFRQHIYLNSTLSVRKLSKYTTSNYLLMPDNVYLIQMQKSHLVKVGLRKHFDKRRINNNIIKEVKT